MNFAAPIATAAQLTAYVKALRKSRGLTQSDVAQMLGVSKMRVATIEKDVGRVATATTIQLLQLLGGTLTLQFDDGSKQSDPVATRQGTPSSNRRANAQSTRGEW